VKEIKKVSTSGYNILIADDHEIVRYGLRLWIDQLTGGARVQEVGTYEELREVLGQRVFTHLILDLRLFGLDMLEKLPFIRGSHPDLAIMVYSGRHPAKYATALMTLGANGFLSKTSNEDDSLAALRQFLRQKSNLGEVAAQRAIAAEVSGSERDLFYRLSFRERQMADLFLKGETGKQIQYALRLKSSTVSTIKRRIFGKLNVSNITELIRLTQERGPV
jgi:DNA-binding NarL/FixJ family response regulator